MMVIHAEMAKGGDWLSAARIWMQSNVRGGDTLEWSSGELVSIPFCKLEELALKVAVATVVGYKNDKYLKELLDGERKAKAEEQRNEYLAEVRSSSEPEHETHL